MPDPAVPGPTHVTLHVWRVAARRVPAAAVRMATHRPRLRGVPGLRFAKLLGTGSGQTFTARDADLRHWALLAAWDEPGAADDFEGGRVVRDWQSLAVAQWRIDMRPLSARGKWSRREPFGRPAAPACSGPVAALTRARLAPAKAARFWRAVPPVASALHECEGLRAAIGIGEAPVGYQGTFSVWASAAALQQFAYQSAAHRDVIRRTTTERWYAEELFARFTVLGSAGTLFGKDPLA